MLYLIGGPGRSGKTTLAMRLATNHGIPYFSLDYLMMGLYHGAPELKVNPNQPEADVAPRMWPVVKPLLIAMLENGEEYCIEGFAITPEHLVPLIELFPASIRSCFLGYATADPQAKLEQERKHQTTNPWPRDIAPKAAIAEFEANRKTSASLKATCQLLGFAYIDTSAAFEAAISQAESILTAAA
jgi:hypothetical protein